MATFDVIVVGAGFSGLYQLWRLRDAGFSVRLVEAADGLGGVWRNNRYPGARVDSHVPNYEYSIEAVWRDWCWTERFPGRDELVAYFDHVDRVLDLRRDIDLSTRIATAHFDEVDAVWDLTTDDGRRYRSRHVVWALGFGSAPYVPDLPGLADTSVRWCHTARWPDDLDLADRRIGVIGTGASAVQVVQEAAPVADRLVVFQRTPVTALPMQQRALDRDEQQRAKADYPEMFRRRNEPPGSFHDLRRLPVGALEVSAAEREAEFDRAWAAGGFHFWVGTFADILLDEAANRTAYEYWRDRTRERISDTRTAEILAPAEPLYPFGTKRPSLEQDYYDVFDRDGVEVVDLRHDPIREVTHTGLRTDAAEFDLDLLVLATGFDANTGGLTRLDLRDSDGVTIADRWAGGVDTHLGMAVPGFPNMFMLYGPQSSASFCNGPVCAEVQGDWLVDLLHHADATGWRRIDAAPWTGPAWTEHLATIADATLFGRTDSWYMGANIPGKPRQLLNYPSSDGYLGALRACAEADYDGFVGT